jgi:hypothetical protein
MEKIVPLFSKIDESFSEANLQNHDLVLLVSGQSCAYSIFDHRSNRFILLESYDIPLHEVVSQTRWLGDPFQSVRIIVENTRSTLIPEPLFEETEKETYLNFSTDAEPGRIVLYDRLATLEIINIFEVDNFLLEQVNRFFPGAKICHVSTHLIESLWMNFKNLITDKRIFLYLREEAFHMMIFDRKQLSYSNAFHFKTPEDFIYFVIFVMEQMNLNPEEIPVTLLGNISKKSPCYELIFKYVRNIDFASRSESTIYSYIFDDLPGHSFYPLVNPIL